MRLPNGIAGEPADFGSRGIDGAQQLRHYRVMARSTIANPLLSEADEALQMQMRAFLECELAPRALAIEGRQDWDALKAAVRAVGAAGYLRLMFRDQYQGPLADPGLTHAVLLSEEAAYVNYAFETTLASALSCAYALHGHGSESVRRKFLPALLDGAQVGAICVTEANVGCDTSAMQTRIGFDALRGEWLIDGHKRYISNAAVADCYIVYGITDAQLPARQGMSAVLVPHGTAGLSFPRRHSFMGRRGCVVGEVLLDGCRVPQDHLLGERNQGFDIMLGMFNFERILLGGAALGVARSAFDIAGAHAQGRIAFGAPLGAKQLIWDKIAEMSWRLDAAALLVYRAAKLYDQGLRGKALMKQAAMAKLVASQVAQHCADSTVQVLGGDGLTEEYGRAEQIYRDARALTIVGGTSEMAKYLIAGRDLPDIRLDL
jgi:alkylation response protein AidB-like acyl-CoA dehydrogenase